MEGPQGSVEGPRVPFVARGPFEVGGMVVAGLPWKARGLNLVTELVELYRHGCFCWLEPHKSLSKLCFLQLC